MPRRPLIAVIGDGTVPEGERLYELAREVGRNIVDEGARLLCGGMGGVMEAAARGAHESPHYQEGDTVGVLPGGTADAANRYIDIAIPTSLGHQRNAIVAQADAIIAIGGGAGTLSEMAFAWMHGRRLVALEGDGWSGRLAGQPLDPRRGESHPSGPNVLRATRSGEAVRLALGSRS